MNTQTKLKSVMIYTSTNIGNHSTDLTVLNLLQVIFKFFQKKTIMKNAILFIFCFLTMQFSIGQNAAGLYRKADSLYNAKDFKSAAIAYGEGIKSQGAATGFNRYLSAASSWTLANVPDSAFYTLDILSKNEKLTQSDYKNIESAKDLAALQSDKRWKPLLAAV